MSGRFKRLSSSASPPFGRVAQSGAVTTASFDPAQGCVVIAAISADLGVYFVDNTGVPTYGCAV